MMSITDKSEELTVAETVAGLLVALAAASIATAYVLDAAGWPIYPATVLTLLALESILVVLWIWRGRENLHLRLDGWGLAGFAVVVIGLFAYIMWLARPSLLPITQSGDMVHHISLIDFIREHHTLVHDLSLSNYLGEMMVYPPGSHILAALVAAWLDTTSLRVLHSLLALLVAMKAGMIYNTILYLIASPRRNPAVAVAGAALLLLGYRYFVLSFTAWYFYAMVIGEIFAVAMLWSLVRWDQQPSSGYLAFFALCGIAVLLVWPGWLPIPLAALTALLLVRRDIQLGNRLRWLAWGAAPIVAVGVIYALSRRAPDTASLTRDVIMHEGAVLRPSITAYSWPLLTLVILGVGISLRNRRALPVLLFLGAIVGQIAVLWTLARNQMFSYYVTDKMFYLLLYPMVIFATLALDTLWHLPSRMWPPAWQIRWQRLTVVLPGLVLGMALVLGLPSHLFSPVSESLHEAGLWSKAHLPNGCVDYLVDHWVTAYWLHVDVLGNPRGSPRGLALTNVSDFETRRNSPERWTDPGGLPVAIVGDSGAVPEDVRSDFKILYQSGPSAVVQRGDWSTCQDSTVPIDQLTIAPRQGTLAERLASLLP